MTALSTSRNTQKRAGINRSDPVAAATTIYEGSLVVLDASGNAEPGSTATGKIAVGRAAETVDNSAGAAADLNVEIETGVFKWADGSSLTKANIGDTVYIDDDQTVNSASSGRSPAGILIGVDTDGVWVETNPGNLLASTGLLAANNLSDVGTAATAATNLGLGTTDSPTFADVTTTDDVTVGDDLAVTGLATVGETLSVTGAADFTSTVKVTGDLTAKGLLSVETATKTVGTAADEGGIVIQDLTDNAVITLPAVAAGNKGMKVTVQNIAADDAALISVSPNAADYIKGTIAAFSAGGVQAKDLQNTKSGSNQGDYVTLVSDGTDTWWIIGGVGVWASEA